VKDIFFSRRPTSLLSFKNGPVYSRHAVGLLSPSHTQVYKYIKATSAVASDRDDGDFFFILFHEKRTFAAGRRERKEKDTAADRVLWHTGRSVTRIIRLRRKRVYENIIITKGRGGRVVIVVVLRARARELLRAAQICVCAYARERDPYTHTYIYKPCIV